MLYRGLSVWYRYYPGHSCFGSLATPPHFSPFSHENYCIWTALGPFLLAPGHLPTIRWSQWCVLRPSRGTGWHWTLYAVKLQMYIKQRYQSEDLHNWEQEGPLEFKVTAFPCEGTEILRSDLLKVKVVIVITRARTRILIPSLNTFSESSELKSMFVLLGSSWLLPTASMSTGRQGPGTFAVRTHVFNKKACPWTFDVSQPG